MEILPWRLVVTGPAKRQIAKLPEFVQRRIFRALEGLREIPRRGDIKAMAGESDDYRLRVGDYRVLFTVHKDSQMVEVTAVRHRSSAYER
jgi:mRNA interferase RelE/StbE